MPLTVLHTSDWHLGHQLYRKKRDSEFAAFLDWLEQSLEQHQVDVLIVAGDIFDVAIPGTSAQSLYYNFLANIAKRKVRHVVITAGNHDSPAFLTAPSTLLQSLDIHVVGAGGEIRDELLALKDQNGKTELIVCATPYLREGALCQGKAGESSEEREKRFNESLKNHFSELAEEAELIRKEEDINIPVIASAHLFTLGLKPEKEESARQLYRGNMGAVPPGFFPDSFDYVALGHIHRPHAVGGNPLLRYSGSPLPLTFAEAEYAKQMVLLHFTGRKAELELLPVPSFRKMLRFSGNSESILEQLAELVASVEPQDNIWLELHHDGSDSPIGLPEKCAALVKDSAIEILCIKSDSSSRGQTVPELDQGLDELKPSEMFIRCMDAREVPEEQREELMESFMELLQIVQEEQCES